MSKDFLTINLSRPRSVFHAVHVSRDDAIAMVERGQGDVLFRDPQRSVWVQGANSGKEVTDVA